MEAYEDGGQALSNIPRILFYARSIACVSIVTLAVLFSTPLARPLRRLWNWALGDFLPLKALVPPEPPSAAQREDAKRRRIRVWRQILLVTLGTLGVGAWTGITGSQLLQAIYRDARVVDVLASAGMMIAWLYLTILPLVHAPDTPPWFAAILYVMLLFISAANLTVVWYARMITGSLPAWASPLFLGMEIGSFVASAFLLWLVGGLPLESPEVLARLPELGMDDTVTLNSWMTFSWMNPFIRFANSKELEQSELPIMSPTIQTAPLFDAFRELKNSTLLRKIIGANRWDIVLDIFWTLASVIFQYAAPFFLKRILEGLTDPTVENISLAYIYAALSFTASGLKAFTDLMHLWHSRRASVRVHSQLVAAIYDKTLRRKDSSGLVTKESKKEDEDTAADGKAKDKGKDAKDAKDKGKDKKPAEDEEKKSNADSGKIVNLMSGDSNRISNMVAVGTFIYGSPLEIIVASVFLYQILGWSAFAGIVVLGVAAPLNSFLSKQFFVDQKKLMEARDKRMGIMNELIPAIQFIKFFAWTSQWRKRVEEARKKELKAIIKIIWLNMGYMLLWNVAPILVTLVSFFCYIVIAKQALTVANAFTAISLFTMLRGPLNIIPTFIVFLLQAVVSVRRIEDFLNEDEVDDWVSSLKRTGERLTVKTRIGFDHASYRWNSGKVTSADDEKDKDKNKKKGDKSEKAKDAPKTPKKTASVPTINVEAGTPAANGNGTNGNGAASTAVDGEAEEEYFKLSNLHVDFPVGKLTVVTGPTGSGKTAILIALLGEMELLSGKGYLPKYPTEVDKKTGLKNSVAYAAQTPWLQQLSIKDNIVFGEPYDEKRYNDTIEACALVPDFEMLEDGDSTEIGQKGISLSGGQKARVALARAVYSYTQHVLLDDPLAAVDSHTAKHLVDKCLNAPILKGRTIIIVSHHLELLLPSSDYVVRILEGQVDAQGTPHDLRERGELDGIVALEEAVAEVKEPIKAQDAAGAELKAVDADAEHTAKEKKPARKLVKDEERQVGNVKWETYKLYIVSATIITWVLGLTVQAISQTFAVGERYWLKVWGEAYITKIQTMLAFVMPGLASQSEHYIHHGDVHQAILHYAPMELGNSSMPTVETFPAGPQFPPAADHPGFYLSGYAIIVVGSAVLGVVSALIGSWGQYRASVTLHSKLLNTVIRGTIRFFNTTPSGRIINRFSKDIETIDTSLNPTLRTVISYVASLVGAIAVVAVIIPWFLIPAFFISWAYYSYTQQYLKVGRSLRRLEATTRSPIFSGFAELLDGVVSVRAFSVERRFMTQLCKQVDETHSANYYYWMMNRWLLLRFDLLGAIAVFLTTVFALSGAVAAGSAGMAILSAQSFVMGCYWVSRFWGQLEMDFNSVERVQEYLEIPQEPPAEIKPHRPPAYWPSAETKEGFLRVEDVEIKYSPELPTVFKGSFEAKAGEKIGLIGRTGSGKSTLAMSLLRFADPASGKIWLDGIDITKIGVDDLRSRITYIPQDAVLFSGTVRNNLDPFDEHTDEELYEALSRVNLGPNAQSRAVSRLPSRVPSVSHSLNEDGRASPSPSGLGVGKTTITLATDVSAGGSNFSQGQRQLIAMARALLRRSNLIIMDEATASVDFATDEAIQSAIRSEFKTSTLLTIAHRLSSVIDYDRLLVLSDGKIVEFDTPINLLKKDDSLFKSLCEKSGRYKELYKAAERKASSISSPKAGGSL